MNTGLDAEHFARTIGFIARTAERVATASGVGGMEIAGMIVSYLYANPHKIPDFVEKGAGAMVDDAAFNHRNGGLSWHAMNGEVISPSELLRREGREREIQ